MFGRLIRQRVFLPRLVTWPDGYFGDGSLFCRLGTRRRVLGPDRIFPDWTVLRVRCQKCVFALLGLHVLRPEGVVRVVGKMETYVWVI